MKIHGRADVQGESNTIRTRRYLETCNMEISLENYEGKQRKRENAFQILSKRNSYPEGLQLSISSEELQQIFLSSPLEDFRSLNQESVPGNIDDWDYNVLQYDITTTRQHAFLLFQSLNLIETFALERAKLMCFIKRISMVYRSNENCCSSSITIHPSFLLCEHSWCQ